MKITGIEFVINGAKFDNLWINNSIQKNFRFNNIHKSNINVGDNKENK